MKKPCHSKTKRHFTHSITFAVTQEQKARVVFAAHIAGVSIGEFLRTILAPIFTTSEIEMITQSLISFDHRFRSM